MNGEFHSLADDAAGLANFEAELGQDFSLDPQTTFETNTGAFRHTLIHRETEFKTELFLLSQDPFDPLGRNSCQHSQN